MLTGSCRTAAGIKLDINSHYPTYCRYTSRSDLCWYSTERVVEYGNRPSDSHNSWRVRLLFKAV